MLFYYINFSSRIRRRGTSFTMTSKERRKTRRVTQKVAEEWGIEVSENPTEVNRQIRFSSLKAS